MPVFAWGPQITKSATAPTENDGQVGTSAKQQKLEVFSSSSKVVNQGELNKLVAGYVVEEMLPISRVVSFFQKVNQ